MNSYKLINGDCLQVMKTLADNSVDLCLTDPPYGTTACKWDSVIPFEPMWKELKRICKPKAAICLFGSQPFTSALVMSNPKDFRYQWYWKKEKGTGFAQSGRRPLNIIEDLTVFYCQQVCYNPQRKPLKKPYKHKGQTIGSPSGNPSALLYKETIYKEYTHDTPTAFLEFARDNACRNSFHPTQKPVELLRYLIRTYTQENETVLDFTMGSGSTGAACQLENRKFIGIEKDAGYFAIAEKRIESTLNAQPLFDTINN